LPEDTKVRAASLEPRFGLVLVLESEEWPEREDWLAPTTTCFINR
jgi:hypothetical protein